MIPYGQHSIDETEIAAVCDTLRSDRITQGSEVDRFEDAVAAYCGAEFAVAVCNGTAALHLACLAAGVKQGSRVWTSPNTFLASANCGLYCGSEVDFVDIDPFTYNMSCDKLAEKLAAASISKTLPDVVIPVHFSGHSCDMAAIRELSEQYGFSVVEDACHAIGGAYKDRKVGSCRYSDMTAFSLHPVKIITTGEGGLILTNNRETYNQLLRLRSHGVTRDSELMTGPSDGPWYYQQIELGFNYRITDFQAALGRCQLRRIDQFIEKRRFLVDRYNAEFEGLPLQRPMQHPDVRSAWHLYVLRLNLEELSETRGEIFNKLRSAGIGVNVHYIPVHTQPFYKNFGFKNEDFPEALRYYRGAITLPLFPDLSVEQQNHIIDTVQRILAT